MPNETTESTSSKGKQHHRAGPRTKVRPRGRTAGRPRGSSGALGSLAKRLDHERKVKGIRRDVRSYKALKRDTLSLFSRQEVEKTARECGFYPRTPRAIKAFEFVLCTALAAVVEGKRGFASVWRLLEAAANVTVARSAVTQRFGSASANLLQTMFEQALKRLPEPACPDVLNKLEEFRAVLANDGSVLTVSPVLKKLFPATPTHSVQAAAKLHATADLVHRRIVRVELTGERAWRSSRPTDRARNALH